MVAVSFKEVAENAFKIIEKRAVISLGLKWLNSGDSRHSGMLPRPLLTFPSLHTKTLLITPISSTNQAPVAKTGFICVRATHSVQ